MTNIVDDFGESYKINRSSRKSTELYSKEGSSIGGGTRLRYDKDSSSFQVKKSGGIWHKDPARTDHYEKWKSGIQEGDPAALYPEGSFFRKNIKDWKENTKKQGKFLGIFGEGQSQNWTGLDVDDLPKDKIKVDQYRTFTKPEEIDKYGNKIESAEQIFKYNEKEKKWLNINEPKEELTPDQMIEMKKQGWERFDSRKHSLENKNYEIYTSAQFERSTKELSNNARTSWRINLMSKD